jgi:hypothetical protein
MKTGEIDATDGTATAGFNPSQRGRVLIASPIHETKISRQADIRAVLPTDGVSYHPPIKEDTYERNFFIREFRMIFPFSGENEGDARMTLVQKRNDSLSAAIDPQAASQQNAQLLDHAMVAGPKLRLGSVEPLRDLSHGQAFEPMEPKCLKVLWRDLRCELGQSVPHLFLEVFPTERGLGARLTAGQRALAFEAQAPHRTLPAASLQVRGAMTRRRHDPVLEMAPMRVEMELSQLRDDRHQEFLNAIITIGLGPAARANKPGK